MKFVRLLFIATLLVTFFSCSKKDDNVTTANQLTGKWKMTELKYTGTTTIGTGGEPSTTPFSGVGKDMDLHIQFTEDPNNFKSYGDYTVTLTMSAGGQSIQNDMPIQGFMGSGTWEKDGSKLMIVDKESGNHQQATISELSGNTMKLLWDRTQVESQSDMQMSVTMKGTYTFKKE